jgi:hypothetical protein
MSRRRPKPPEQLPDGARKIRVVCTKRGQHQEWQFGYVTVALDDDGSWHVIATTFGAKRVSLDDRSSTPAKVSQTDDGVLAVVRVHAYPTWQFRCQRCGDNMPKRVDTLEKLSTQRDALDTLKVDLSQLSE